MQKRRRLTGFSQLGELESNVMSVVWEKGKATVQEVKDALDEHRPLAYTTVMTVMTRLAEKGLLDRHKEGRAHVYTPAVPQEKVSRSLLRSLVKRLYDGATVKAIAHLLDSDEEVDDADLEQLENLIREKRQGHNA